MTFEQYMLKLDEILTRTQYTGKTNPEVEKKKELLAQMHNKVKIANAAAEKSKSPVRYKVNTEQMKIERVG